LVLRPFEDGDLGRWMRLSRDDPCSPLPQPLPLQRPRLAGTLQSVPDSGRRATEAAERSAKRKAEGGSQNISAGLVDQAEDWRWTSLALRSLKPVPKILSPSPVTLPKNWTAIVNRPQRAAEENVVRHSVLRGTPYGGERWTSATAARLNLESTLRPRGRPRKHPPK
jgi:hypothetical protein